MEQPAAPEKGTVLDWKEAREIAATRKVPFRTRMLDDGRLVVV